MAAWTSWKSNDQMFEVRFFPVTNFTGKGAVETLRLFFYGGGGGALQWAAKQ
jgi:hypothetical protein